jgi:hypothetical protein
MLPASTPSLAGGLPSMPPGDQPAPPGTIFVLSAEGGYAVPPRRFTLMFGRGKDDVHVPVGANDPYVSRLHGLLKCDGREWWVRNEGRLPIRLPGQTMLLSGHELLMQEGYTPLLIGQTRSQSHLLEIHVVGSGPAGLGSGPRSRTKVPGTYDLNDAERLVLTALAQRYLRQERHPQPVAWKQVADDLNRLNGRTWNAKVAANTVEAVRKRLASEIPGIVRDDGIGEPVGNVLNHNLIQALLETTTLMPSDLTLLGED